MNTYSYDDQNRLTDITTKVNNSIVKVTSYTLDNNGNQLTTTVKTYSNEELTSPSVIMENVYDNQNQLIKTGSEDGTVTKNVYNAEGYRISKDVNGVITHYLYEADKVILEVDAECKQTARNVYGTNLLMRTADSNTYYYMYNGHADVVALIKKDGTIAATYYYDAFGNILESSGDANNNILYAGYQYDKETGLYYCNSRMYDPKIARFLSKDTYNGNIKDPLSLNKYTYCNNEPLMYFDPTGHFGVPNWMKKVGSWVSNKASDAWDATTSAVSSGYNYVSGNVSNAATWTNDNIIQPTVKTVVNVAKKTPEVAVKALNTVIQVGSDALGKSYEATKGIAPYTKTAMDVNKKANPLYWAFDYSTEQGWFSGAFDVGGFYRDDNKIYHAKQSGSLQSWKYAGYNNLYDSVFNGTWNDDKRWSFDTKTYTATFKFKNKR